MGTKLLPTMEYYKQIGAASADRKTEDLEPNSILLDSPQRIIDHLATVEATEIVGVILYFNFGRKPDTMVRAQMDRFIAEIAPVLDGSHRRVKAAVR